MSEPVFVNAKHPVTYVFFTSPEEIQFCPNNEACWSPKTAVIGTFFNIPSFVPVSYTHLTLPTIYSV